MVPATLENPSRWTSTWTRTIHLRYADSVDSIYTIGRPRRQRYWVLFRPLEPGELGRFPDPETAEIAAKAWEIARRQNLTKETSCERQPTHPDPRPPQDPRLSGGQRGRHPREAVPTSTGLAGHR